MSVVFVTGCVSYIQAPEAMGRVVEAESGKPIHGAMVTRASIRSSWRIPHGLPEKTVQTSRVGRFRFAAVRGSDCLLNLHGNPEVFTVAFRVDAPGYTGTNITGIASSNSLWRVELGRIPLKRQ